MREKVTAELVYRLAQELADEGVKPTVMLIRARNGDHGSPNVITPLLRNWKKEREDSALQSLEPEKPMPENLVELLKPVWAAMLREARSEIEGLQTGFEVGLKEKEDELSQYSDTIERLTAERDQARAERDEEQQQLQQAQEELTEQQQTITILNSSTERLQDRLNTVTSEKEQQAQQMQQQTTHVTRLTVENEKLQKSLQQIHDENSELSVQLTSEKELQEQQMQQQTTQVTRLTVENEQLQKSLQQIHDENSELSVQLTNKIAELSARDQQVSDINNKLFTTRKELDKQCEALASSQKECANVERRAQDAENYNSVLSQNLTDCQTKLQAVEEAVQKSKIAQAALAANLQTTVAQVGELKPYQKKAEQAAGKLQALQEQLAKLEKKLEKKPE